MSMANNNLQNLNIKIFMMTELNNILNYNNINKILVIIYKKIV
jgi:hypothetical protein